MNDSIYHGPEGLEEFAEKCALALLADPKHEFIYPIGCSQLNWPVEEIKNKNKLFLETLRGKANVYALFIRSPSESKWLPVYVGQRKSLCLRERITQHLIDKSIETGSMLEKVKNAVTAGNQIGISLIKVHPESLRVYVEEVIISNNKQTLSWNTHS